MTTLSSKVAERSFQMKVYAQMTFTQIAASWSFRWGTCKPADIDAFNSKAANPSAGPIG